MSRWIAPSWPQQRCGDGEDSCQHDSVQVVRMIGTEGIPSLFTTLVSSTKPVCAPDPLDPTTLPETELTQARLQTVRIMLNAGWPVQNVVRGSWLGQDGAASNGTVA